MRIGINVGEADEDQGDYYGLPVSVARRLCDSAEGAGSFVSRTVRDLVGDRAAASIEGLGPRPLKGLPTEVFEVRWTPDSTAGQLPPPLTSRERRFVGRTAELSELGGAIRRSRQRAAARLPRGRARHRQDQPAAEVASHRPAAQSCSTGAATRTLVPLPAACGGSAAPRHSRRSAGPSGGLGR